jgi:hypothetical protein
MNKSTLTILLSTSVSAQVTISGGISSYPYSSYPGTYGGYAGAYGGYPGTYADSYDCYGGYGRYGCYGGYSGYPTYSSAPVSYAAPAPV